MSAPYYDPTANWSLIPQYMHGAVKRYVMHGIPPGSFLTAVLSNDLKEAYGRADDENSAAMRGWVQFIYSYTPSPSQGSPECVRAWIERGGILGRSMPADETIQSEEA